MKKEAKRGVGGTVWDNPGTIRNLAVSGLAMKTADCPCPTAKVCGGCDVILYKYEVYKVASWVGRV